MVSARNAYHAEIPFVKLPWLTFGTQLVVYSSSVLSSLLSAYFWGIRSRFFMSLHRYISRGITNYIFFIWWQRWLSGEPRLCGILWFDIVLVELMCCWISVSIGTPRDVVNCYICLQAQYILLGESSSKVSLWLIKKVELHTAHEQPLQNVFSRANNNSAGGSS